MENETVQEFLDLLNENTKIIPGGVLGNMKVKKYFTDSDSDM